MELRHVRYFLAVAEEKNFTRAAARVGIGQPPLSQQVKDLEAEVGAALFRRVPQGAELTAAGEAFLQVVQGFPAQAERAIHAAQRAARGESGSPFVLTPRSAGPTVFDTIVTACRKAGFEPVLGQSAPQMASLIHFVAAELGVSLVPASMRSLKRRVVRSREHEELWVPAGELSDFNAQIGGQIEVVAGYFGEGFQGYVPEKLGLKGKGVEAQFTALARTLPYSRFDFSCEIAANHTVIFLGFFFWEQHDFANDGFDIVARDKALAEIKRHWAAGDRKSVPLGVVGGA